MDYNNDSHNWDWQTQAYSLQQNTSLEDIPECILNGNDENEDLSYMFEDEATPVKACGDFAYQVTNVDKELEKRGEPFSQVKRRRMLQFGSEVLDASLRRNEAFLRSKETPESLEVASSEISQWVSGFTEGRDVYQSSNECLDISSEGWLAGCLNDSEMQYNSEDISNVPGTSDVEIDISEFLDAPLEYEQCAVKKLPIRPHKNIVLKGQKSYMQTPKLATSIVYPFAFIKPCGVSGDVTLKDINRRIHTPSKPEDDDDEVREVYYPTSAISGKPVVGKTKIRTEGGKGSVTITRTKG